MEIKIHSFGSAESLDLRNVLEGMYRRMGEVVDVSFPDDNTTRIVIKGNFRYENEYGIHRMIRVSPRYEDDKRRTSHVMVEINGKSRDSVICTYDFDKFLARNHITDKIDRDLYYVLNGHPLEMTEDVNVLMYEYV